MGRILPIACDAPTSNFSVGQTLFLSLSFIFYPLSGEISLSFMQEMAYAGMGKSMYLTYLGTYLR